MDGNFRFILDLFQIYHLLKRFYLIFLCLRYICNDPRLAFFIRWEDDRIHSCYKALYNDNDTWHVNFAHKVVKIKFSSFPFCFRSTKIFDLEFKTLFICIHVRLSTRLFDFFFPHVRAKNINI